MQISTRPDGVYAMFNKKFSSFALFEGRGSSIKELVPYQISARYEPREKDKKVIVGLRKCSFGERIIGTKCLPLLYYNHSKHFFYV